MDQFLTTLYAQLFADSDERDELGKTNAFPAQGSYVDVHKQKVKEVTGRIKRTEKLIEAYLKEHYRRVVR